MTLVKLLIRINLGIMIALIIFFSFASVTIAAKPGTTAEAAPTFVSPTLNVDIPGLKFTDVITRGGEFEVNFLGDYVSAMYRYLIGISSIIAIVMLMIGGLQYVLASGGTDTGKAKKRIKDAATGVVLLLSVYLILYTVNPSLVLFGPLRLERIERIPIEVFEEPGDVAEKGSELYKSAVCKSKAECLKWCNDHPDPSSWPTSTEKTIDPKLTRRIPNSTGLKNSSGTRGTEELITALARAGEIAKKKGEGFFYDTEYLLVAYSGFRPLKTQIKMVCNRYKIEDPVKREKAIKEIGSLVAYPGGSNHGSGIAIDLYLADGAKKITPTSKRVQNNSEFEDPGKLLAEIMAEAGFVRYSKELWHFELKGKGGTSCRCKGASCPFPPKC